MKKTILLLSTVLLASAAQITLTPQQEKNWQIQTAPAQNTDHVPLGNFMMEVTIPPQLLQTVSLPFEAQITQLYSAAYTHVKKADVLASATGTEWIEAQKSAISDAIELIHHEHIAERKAKLCEEEIIAQKECTAANAELKTDRIKVAASKTLLRAYGATDTMLKRIFTSLEIVQNVPVSSPVEGTILQVGIKPGESVAPASAMFIIKKSGNYWLESDMPLNAAAQLRPNQTIMITIANKQLPCRVLQLSPVINPVNQTRHVRFVPEKHSDLLAGMRTSAAVTLPQKALLVPKKSVVKNNNDYIVFIKESGVFHDVTVTVLGETSRNYYLRFDKQLTHPIAITSAAVLKGMLEDETDE